MTQFGGKTDFLSFFQFADENFELKHEAPMYLSMANAGKLTNLASSCG